MTSPARPDRPLSLIQLNYVAPLAEIDARMKDHVTWLEAGIREGAILVAGRRNPRTGGVILLRGDRVTAEAVAATDPFVTSGVAQADIVEFSASFARRDFAELLS